MNLIFLDIETTGLIQHKCEIIECAYKYNDKFYSSLFKPTEPIPYEISGITNIDNKDVEDKELFQSSSMLDELKKIASTGAVAICHNAAFDTGVLYEYGVKFQKSICTYNLAWLLYKDIANHKLGTLRALFGIPNTGEAHRAQYDVEILVKVFEKIWLSDEISKLNMPYETIDDMVKISDFAKKERLSIWTFGKFKGQKIDKYTQGNYILWNIENNQSISPEFRNYLNEVLYAEENNEAIN